MKELSELGVNCSNYMWFGSDKQIIEKIAMRTDDVRIYGINL